MIYEQSCSGCRDPEQPCDFGIDLFVWVAGKMKKEQREKLDSVVLRERGIGDSNVGSVACWKVCL